MNNKFGLLLIFIVSFAVFSGCLGGGDEGGDTPKTEWVVRGGGNWGPKSGRTEENEETIVTVDFNHTHISGATFKLTWTDTNAPGDPEPAQDDRFTIEVTPPNGSGEPTKKSGTGSSLSLDVSAGQNIEEPVENGKGWRVTITIEPGEGSTGPGPGPLIIYTDSGNDWTLKVEYKFLEEQEIIE